MASQSLRESFNSLGWSRRDAEPATTAPQQTGLLNSIRSMNPFQRSGYVSLPTHENQGAPLPAPTRQEEEEGWFVRESSPYRHASFDSRFVRVPCVGKTALHRAPTRSMMHVIQTNAPPPPFSLFTFMWWLKASWLTRERCSQ